METIELKRKEDGSVDFTASFNDQQAKFVFEIGLNYLLMAGAATQVPPPAPEEIN